MIKQTASAQTNGPLRVLPREPAVLYGRERAAVYLTGSHTWGNGQAAGYVEPPAPFDFASYLDYLQGEWPQLHSAVGLGAGEVERGESGRLLVQRRSPICGQGRGRQRTARLKWDLTQFDEQFFDAAAAACGSCGQRGMYVSIMLFDGWSVETTRDPANNPWQGHPFNAANNINGVNGDANGDNRGWRRTRWRVPAITALQEAYVRKVIDTVGDLDNVLYEISNESHRTIDGVAVSPDRLHQGVRSEQAEAAPGGDDGRVPEWAQCGAVGQPRRLDLAQRRAWTTRHRRTTGRR